MTAAGEKLTLWLLYSFIPSHCRIHSWPTLASSDGISGIRAICAEVAQKGNKLPSSTAADGCDCHRSLLVPACMLWVIWRSASRVMWGLACWSEELNSFESYPITKFESQPSNFALFYLRLASIPPNHECSTAKTFGHRRCCSSQSSHSSGYGWYCCRYYCFLYSPHRCCEGKKSFGFRTSKLHFLVPNILYRKRSFGGLV